MRKKRRGSSSHSSEASVRESRYSPFLVWTRLYWLAPWIQEMSLTSSENMRRLTRIVIWSAYFAGGAVAAGSAAAASPFPPTTPAISRARPGDASLGNTLFRAHDAADESLALHGLHDVVGRLRFECGQRELGMRGYEDYVRNRLADLLHQLQPAAARHLDVHEDEVGLLVGDLAPRIAGGRGFADDLHIVIGRKQRAQHPTTEFFVVHDERTHPIRAVVHVELARQGRWHSAT